MASALDRFHAKTEPLDDGSGCIVWTGCRQPNGYGKFGVNYVTVLTHRWIYEQTHGVTLDRLQWVLHSCDNPPCVNVAHLRAGTPSDNHADMDARGRRVKGASKGEANASAKLTEDTVVEIRGRRAKGETLASIADDYSVSVSLVNQIALRRVWKHVA